MKRRASSSVSASVAATAPAATATAAVEPASRGRSSSWVRYLLRPLLIIVFIVFLLIALLALLLSFASPYVGRYQSEIQSRVSDYLGTPVALGEMKLDWRLTSPRLEIEDVRILSSENDTESPISFRQVRLDLNLRKTLFQSGWHVNQVSVVGADLEVDYYGERDLRIKGIAGSSNSDSESGNANDDVAGNTSLAWLLQTGRAALLESSITINDIKRDRVFQFDSIDVEARNDGNDHRFDAELALPGSLGESLKLTIDLQTLAGSRNFDLQQTNGSVLLEGRGVKVENWLEFLPQRKLQLAGIADMRLEGEWGGRKLNNLSLQLGSSAVNLSQVSDTAAATMLEALAADMSWLREPDGWNAQINDLQFVYEGVRNDLAASEIRVSDASGVRTWRAKTSGRQIDLNALSVLATNVAPLLPMGSLPEYLLASQPKGTFTDWRINVDRGMASNDASASPSLSIKGSLQDVEIQQSGPIPYVSGVAARIDVENNVGSIELNGTDLSLQHPKIFSEPLNVQSIAATLDIDFDDGAKVIKSRNIRIDDRGLEAFATAAIDVSDSANPDIDMNIKYALDDATKIRRYLPRGRLHPRLIVWLDNSIRGGRVSDGFLRFKGNPKNFPFTEKPGVFAATLHIEDGELKFRDDWPALNRVSGDLTFSKESLVFELDKGRFGSSPVSSATAAISTLFRPVVRVTGKARQSIDEYLTLLPQTPLNFLKTALADLEGTGNAALDIELQVPVRRPQFREADEFLDVTGGITFNGNQLSSELYRTTLEQVTGRLGFTHTGVLPSKIQALHFDRPVVIDATSKGEGKRQRSEMLISGLVDPKRLATEFRIPVVSNMHGTSRWTSLVTIPHDADLRERNGVSMTLDSDLVGTTLNWPEPLNKPADNAVKLSVATRFGQNLKNDWTIGFGNRAQGLVRMGDEGEGLESMTIKLGSEAPKVGDLRPGILVQGSAPRLSFDNWFRAINTLIDDIDDLALPDTDDDKPPLAITANIRTPALMTGNVIHGPAKVRITSDDNFINGVMENQRVAGNVRIPRDEDDVVQIRIASADRALLESLQTGSDQYSGVTGEGPIDPLEIPPLHVHLTRLDWGELELKNIVIRTEPDRAGMKITTIGFAQDTAQLTGDGFWHWQDPQGVNPAFADKQTTNLDLQIRSGDIGTALDNLGLSRAMAEGRGSIDVSLGWPGPLYEPDLATLYGTVDVELRKGRILAVDPGAARIFGLFALQSIPRRLSLNFKDFLHSGLEYTAIEGNVTLANGLVSTELLQLRGPIGVIDITGNSNLVERSYNQKISVLPRITGALPLIGIISAGATGGIGALLAGPVLKALGINLDKVGLTEFSLDGPWDSPNINKLQSTSVPIINIEDRR